MVKLIKGEKYAFSFAGQTKTGTYLGTTILSDGSTSYKFKSTNSSTLYPIKLEQLCGNSKR